MHAFNSSSTCRFFTLREGHDRFAPEGRKRGSCIIIWFFILTYLPMGSTMYKWSVRDDHAGGSRVSADRERERAKGAQQSAIELLILLSPMLIHLRFSLQMRSNQFSRSPDVQVNCRCSHSTRATVADVTHSYMLIPSFRRIPGTGKRSPMRPIKLIHIGLSYSMV